MELRIQKHPNKDSQAWFGTELDSQMFFSESWYGLPKDILNKYFQIGHNGGSYSINFDSKDIHQIIIELTKLYSPLEVNYFIEIEDGNGLRNKLPTNREGYLKYIVSNKTTAENQMMAKLSHQYM